MDGSTSQEIVSQKELEQLSDRELLLIFIRDLRRVQEDFANFQDLVKPIVASYSAAVKMGKWAMVGITAIGILLGIARSILGLTHK